MGAEVSLEFKPCALVASLTRRGDGFQLLLAGHAQKHRRIVMWISMSGAARAPIATQFGPLALPPGEDPGPPDRTDLPFCFERLPHYSVTAYTGEANTWRAEVTGVISGPQVEELVVQGVVYLQKGSLDAVTEPVRIRVGP